MRALKFITGHVIFKLRCNQIYQLKTTYVLKKWLVVVCKQFKKRQVTKQAMPDLTTLRYIDDFALVPQIYPVFLVRNTYK